MLKTKTALLSLIMTSALTAPAFAGTVDLDAGDRSDIRITVYNGNFAAVSETRKLEIGQGLNRIEFQDVSAAIEPETALLEGGNFKFLEQNFDYDLLSPQKMIEKAVGKTIRVERTNPATGEKETKDAVVLSANNGVVLQYDDGIEIFGQGGLPERFAFKDIPENLRAKPTLSTLIDAPSSYNGDVQLSYLTGGFVWKADYVGSLNAAENAMDIQAWVTLTNNSGTSFSNVKLQVMAGDVNRAVQPRAVYEMAAPQAMDKAAASREAIGDFHLYTIPNKTDLLNNQTKQLALFSASDVPVKKLYVYNAQGRTATFEPVPVFYQFENTEENHLGNPIPAGMFRLYLNDKAGEAQFIGEQSVPNTPEGRKVSLHTGQAFDVTVSEKMTSYSTRDISEKPGVRQYETTTGKEVTFKNAMEKAVTVKFYEHLLDNWEITKESAKYTKQDATTVYWEITVPAKGEATLTYTKRTW